MRTSLCYYKRRGDKDMLTKSQQLLLYLMKLKGGVVDDKTKFAKYQYFTDFIHYAFYAKPVSEDIIYTRQKQGPLSRNLTDDLEELKRQGYIKESPTYKYTLAKDFNLRLSADEKRTARFVMSKYGQLSYADLIQVCHAQAPYLSSKDGGVIEYFTAFNLVDDYQDYADFKD